MLHLNYFCTFLRIQMNNFTKAIIQWYTHNKRDLPWRETSDPYKIWISEVILQQTRVVQGLGYYLRFTSAFPTVIALANAPLDDVLKLWQGLGYYSRARNLHQTAKQIVEIYDGKIPSTYSELIKLKGIGDYTASAIAAFAFKVPIAAVDGNVFRIFSRYYGIDTPIDTTQGRKTLHAIAQEMVDRSRPDVYNQAIMDFGSLMCSPQKPDCFNCPVLESCQAFRSGTVDLLPAKSKKIKVRTRYFSYILIRHGSYTYLHQRQDKDIWHSLYEFPLIESDKELSVEELLKTAEWNELVGNAEVSILNVSPIVKHPLSHQNLLVRFYIVEVQKVSYSLSMNYKKVPINEVDSYSTPRVIDSYMAAEPAERYFTGKPPKPTDKDGNYYLPL